MGKSHISVRKHMWWDPSEGEPSEPTSTVVLTSGRGHYVDIRVLKDKDVPISSLTLDTPSLEKLDWGFAGVSKELKPPSPDDESQVMEWIHWVDSRHLQKERGKPSSDVGHCFSLPNGDMLEKGSMKNPATGIVTEYEELWGDVEIETTPHAGNREKIVTVLRTVGSSSEHDSKASNGMVIRVGQFIQGIIVQDRQLALERWHYGGKWERQIRMGSSSLSLPCALLFEPSDLAEGEEVANHGVRWQVLEKQVG